MYVSALSWTSTSMPFMLIKLRIFKITSRDLIISLYTHIVEFISPPLTRICLVGYNDSITGLRKLVLNDYPCICSAYKKLHTGHYDINQAKPVSPQAHKLHFTTAHW